MRRSSCFLAALAALLLAGAADAQAREWFLLLDGAGGPISANSGTTTQGLTDRSPVLSYGQNVFVPIDAQGTPGQLQLRPLRVVKEVDGASPRAAQAVATGEEINDCVLTLYEFGPGAPMAVYEIEVGGARLIGVSGGGGADLAQSQGSAGTETLTILFQSVTQTDIASGQTTTIP